MAEELADGKEVLNGGHGAAQPPMSRIVSVKQLHLLLDISRNTIDKMLADGAPYVEKGDVLKGIKWKIDVAAFVKWLVEREKAKIKAGSDDDVDWDELATLKTPAALEYRQQLSRTLTAEYARAEKERSLAPIQPLLDMMAADRAALSNRLMGVGRQVIEKDLADLDKALLMRIEEAVNRRQREALASMKDDEILMEDVLALADA